MAGKKGRSGGPRANAGGPRENSGGARPGAGRKPKPPVLSDSDRLLERDPEKWLENLMVDPSQEIADRKDAAKALLTFKGKKLEAPGKKGAKQAAAGAVASQPRFAPGSAPPLRAVK